MLSKLCPLFLGEFQSTVSFFKEFLIFPIPFFFKIFFWNEKKGGGVYTVTQSCGFGAVREEMAKMRVGIFAPDFHSFHKVTSVFQFCDIIGRKGFCEAWPSGSGFEFIQRTEQRFPGYDVNIYAFLFVIPVFI